MERRTVLDLSRDELAATLAAWGEPAYRGRQVWEWIWEHLVDDYSAMTNLPAPLRKRLEQALPLVVPEAGGMQLDADEGTEKVLLTLSDGEAIETVLMREGERRTVCVSTQVGCPLGCRFCATGTRGYSRDLSAGEIASQVLHFARRLATSGQRVTHVVFMGMGEPLLNYDATLKAIRMLHEPQGLGIGARRITVSTIGVVPGIRRLAGEGLELGLAISLHAADDRTRMKLVPAGRRWSLRSVLAAAEGYARVTGRRVTYEYVLLSGVNDGPPQARALVRVLRGRLAHVNLIPFNPAPGLPFQRPSLVAVDLFRRILVEGGVDATVRYSRGTKILAGCGQLRGRTPA